MDFEQNFLTRYNQLNDRQRQAVDAIEGPVLVVAGPGSGKTELLSLRVANIIRQTDAEPDNIICLTFTDAAAVNMRARLAGLIGQAAYRVSIHTFHGFCTDIINRHPEYFYHGATFFPADKLTQREFMREILDSLPHDHALRSYHPDEGYVYLEDLISAIGHLKKSGLSPVEFAAIVAQNVELLDKVESLVSPVFSGTLTTKVLPEVERLCSELYSLGERVTPVAEVEPLPIAVAREIERSLIEAERIEKATPLSKWKNAKTRKASRENNERVMKMRDAVDKHAGLAEIYALYQQKMADNRFYDFDDMLLDVLKVLGEYPSLGLELQEQFQYILVDEFQDTNSAQMRLLHALTDAEVHEGRPNIMAVGDDDQAVYKFQGAEIANIIGFTQHYHDTQVVVLTQNYRSTQAILDVARQVIVQGEVRLENQLTVVEKQLEAANSTLVAGAIVSRQYTTQEQEFYGVAQEIKGLLSDGANADEIAVICRQHKYLMALVPYLQQSGIPVRYEKQQNVLDEPHIHQLIQIVRFAVSVGRKQAEADNLLPEILSYPFWQLDRLAVWRLSVQADTWVEDDETGQKRRRGWLECMLEGNDEQLKRIGLFLVDLGTLAEYETIDYILEKVIGAHDQLLPDDDTAELLDEEVDPQPDTSFVSPFKEYYFSQDKYENERSEYLRFLSSLKVFMDALRKYGQSKPLKAEDLLAFVEMYEESNLPITDTSTYITGEKAVNLLTAHAAKGLEFDTVFVLSCQQDIWGQGKTNNRLSAPANVPLSSAASDTDDFLRLFYVALTRARQNLYMTSFKTNSSGGEVERVGFIADQPLEAGQEFDSTVVSSQILPVSWKTYHAPPVARDEQALLLPLVEQYKMSVTHLNNFLDVSRGGPRLFLEQNLLRFPQPMSAPSSYGTAVHEAIREFCLTFKRDEVLPNLEVLLEMFTRHLEMQRLRQHDHDNYLHKGIDELTLFYDARSSSFNLSDEIEFNFNNQQVMVGDACLTGKIDRIVKLVDNKVSVHDIKTGKPADGWQGSDANSKSKLHKYKYQLMFYKLLIERSRQFGGKQQVAEGVLEFVQPLDGEFVILPLPMSELGGQEMERLCRLIEVVHAHIQQLNFPDTSEYSQDLKGIVQFEEDLLEGRI